MLNPFMSQNLTSAMTALKSAGDPSSFVKSMYESNPDFKSFVDKNSSVGVDELFKQHGMDTNDILNKIKSFL